MQSHVLMQHTHSTVGLHTTTKWTYYFYVTIYVLAHKVSVTYLYYSAQDHGGGGGFVHSYIYMKWDQTQSEAYMLMISFHRNISGQ